MLLRNHNNAHAHNERKLIRFTSALDVRYKPCARVFATLLLRVWRYCVLSANITSQLLRALYVSMASPFAPTLLLLLLSICALTAQVSSQLDCPSESYALPNTSSLSDTVHLLRTDSAEEARHAALCHVACVSFTFSDIFFEEMNTSRNGTNSTEPEAVSDVF